MATMAHLDKPEMVGHGIAGAFVATFWGVFLANGVWLPIANKLTQLSKVEIAHKMLVVEGIMAIQAGVSPRVVEEMLKSHMPPSQREEVAAAPAAAPTPSAKPRSRLPIAHVARRGDRTRSTRSTSTTRRGSSRTPTC